MRNSTVGGNVKYKFNNVPMKNTSMKKLKKQYFYWYLVFIIPWIHITCND